jgi:hypothetical protein
MRTTRRNGTISICYFSSDTKTGHCQTAPGGSPRLAGGYGQTIHWKGVLFTIDKLMPTIDDAAKAAIPNGLADLVPSKIVGT